MQDNAPRGRALLPELAPSDAPDAPESRRSAWADDSLDRLWRLSRATRRACDRAWMTAEGAVFSLPLTELAFMMAAMLLLLSGSR